MTSEKGTRKEKNQNIQVFVRLRPINQRERDIKSLGVVEVVNGREVVVRQSQQTSHTKRFTFDRAFGPNARQVEVYQEVVSPLIEEVLAGYNCTVFAYGQTGTGKTHTMVGENSGDETNWQNDPLAGIIPRALSQLFDELRLTNTEYTVRVSYLELYNEELFDLLATSDDNSKLRIYEDVSRKGSNIVNGLEEITVYNKNEVYKIMAQGQERKRVASTLMNAQSSRSHTVFTIVVHMKENSPEGEELVKIGKLNLVDLAGSENISKAGSDNPAKRERARECVNINQSLLTLGRVITALVERHPHIPYRESKLTRILQESLGGRTKTSIIATVSPGHKDLEETMSTLEYANRAKNIQNKPEVNQKMTKKAILKEYAEEIDRLKRDLQAARDKNGVYLANETFAEMTLKQEEQRKEIQELLLRKRAMEEERDRMETVFSDQGQKLQQRESELNNTRDVLEKTKIQLANTCNILQSTQSQFEEQKQLLEFQRRVERELSAQAQQILSAADQATSHLQYLHDAFDKRKSVEARNAEVTAAFRSACSQRRERLSSAADSCVCALASSLHRAREALETHTAENIKIYDDSRNKLEELVKNTTEAISALAELEVKVMSDLSTNTSEQQEQMRSTVHLQSGRLQESLEKTAGYSIGVLQNVAELDLQSSIAAYLEQWRVVSASAVGRVRHSAAQLGAGGVALGGGWAAAASSQARSRAQHLQRLDAAVREHQKLMLEDKEHTERKLSEQIADIEKEKADTESRLAEWAEEERRLLEERIARLVAKEQVALEERVKQRREQIEEQRRQFEQRMSRNLEWLNAMLSANRHENESTEEDLRRNELDVKEHLVKIDHLTRQCDEEINSVSASVESISADVLNVIGQVKSQMVEALNDATEKVKVETLSMKSTNREVTEELTAKLDAATSAVAQHSAHAVKEIVNRTNLNNTSTIQQLSNLASTVMSLQSACEAHSTAQSENINATQREMEQFYSTLREEMSGQEDLEERCLKEEFKIYSPTGRTPLRREYRYPRRLASAQTILKTKGSPRRRPRPPLALLNGHDHDHDHQSDNDDCVVVECTERQERQEAEAREARERSWSGSKESLAPSPPPVLKCTSETDIYARQRQERAGKENANVNRSMSFRKPSKLPAPASLKKPLLERN